MLPQIETYWEACLLLEKSIIPTYLQELDKAGIPHYIFACSKNELPDETKSSKCSLYYPLKKINCFSRSLSDSKKKFIDLIMTNAVI